MRRTFLKQLATMGAGLAPLAGFDAAWAQGPAYPVKPIRLIVPFPPGGGTDAIARAVGERMGSELGQSFVIDNKPGAGGMIGADAGARSPADGYNLLIGTNSTLVTNKYLYAKMPYDPASFELIGLIGITPLLLLANPSVPAKTVPELVAYAKANPGKLSYASFGNGTTSHLAGELFKQMAGVDMLHVPFKGASEALPAIIGGQVSLYFDTIVSGLPHVKSGKLNALAVTSARRSAILPAVPTIAEQGYPGYEIYPWYGMVAPKGTPKEALERLRTVLGRAVRDPQLVEKLVATGAEVTPMSATEFAEMVRLDHSKTEKLVKTASVSLE
ncbi:tripartite tricarboxylate transporter substrate binding protein [Xylophilus rhododendri]|uniref:Tripartite tricarboxylate transporter substrate binding protein n=1 Tax=Xylophilus rhododendri TaxID=2697032 RepID=A0A857J3A9_9BURK|nr:tripartite tricarboxylate transporter substrate binding protein [Xylophilus rhododendri]QHI97542.1 tripartite tricarboxylate transporter substrate binding protein [Xylophilus rhododendri]